MDWEALKKFAKFFEVINAAVKYTKTPKWDENMNKSEPDFLVVFQAKKELKTKETQSIIPRKATIALFMTSEQLDITDEVSHNALAWTMILEQIKRVGGFLEDKFNTSADALLKKISEVMKEELQEDITDKLTALASVVDMSSIILKGDKERKKKIRKKVAQAFESYIKSINPELYSKNRVTLREIISAIEDYSVIRDMDSSKFERYGLDKHFNLNVRTAKKGFLGSKDVYVFIPAIKINNKRFYSIYPWSFTYYKKLTEIDLQEGSEYVRKSKTKKGIKKALSYAGAIASGVFAKGLLPVPGVRDAWADFAVNKALSFLYEKLEA